MYEEENYININNYKIMRKLIIMFLAVMLSSISVYGQNVMEPVKMFCSKECTDFYTIKTGKYPTEFRLAIRVRKLGDDKFAYDFMAAEKIGSGYSEFESQSRRADVNSIYGYSLFDVDGKLVSYAFEDSPNQVMINDYRYRIFTVESNKEDMRAFCNSYFMFGVMRFYLRDIFGRYESDADVGKHSVDVVVYPDKEGLVEFYNQLSRLIGD